MSKAFQRSREEVNKFLARLKEVLMYGPKNLEIVIRNDKKNERFRIEEGFCDADYRIILNNLTVQYYRHSLPDDRYADREWYVFQPKYITVHGKQTFVYIKVRVIETQCAIACLSFHEAEYLAEGSYPYKC